MVRCVEATLWRSTEGPRRIGNGAGGGEVYSPAAREADSFLAPVGRSMARGLREAVPPLRPVGQKPAWSPVCHPQETSMRKTQVGAGGGPWERLQGQRASPI